MHICGEKLLAILLILNALSFVTARVFWYITGEFGAELEVAKPAEDGEKMYYLVAGCVNQPATAFEFLTNELDGGITFVNYRATRGCNIKNIADQVIADAEKHNYQARVIGISIGDYVSRRVEAARPGSKTVGINPEPEPNILRSWSKAASRVGSIIVEALTVPLGWLSVIPWYNGCGNRFSMAFIADQFRDIGYIGGVPHAIDGTVGVIISERPDTLDDQFLDNPSIKEYFDGVPIVPAKAGHGDTVGSADEFLTAWQALEIEDF